MNYLGDNETSTISIDVHKDVHNFIDRFSKGTQDQAVETVKLLSENCEKLLSGYVSMGQYQFDSNMAKNGGVTLAGYISAYTALTTIWDIEDIAKKYPKKMFDINKNAEIIDSSVNDITQWDPSLGDIRNAFYQERDKAIQEGDLDHPSIPKDLKYEIIRKVYSPDSSINPVVVESVSKKYALDGSKKSSNNIPVLTVLAAGALAFLTLK